MCARHFRTTAMGTQLNTSVPNRVPAGKNSTAEKLLVAASELMIERHSIEFSLSDHGIATLSPKTSACSWRLSLPRARWTMTRIVTCGAPMIRAVSAKLRSS